MKKIILIISIFVVAFALTLVKVKKNNEINVEDKKSEKTNTSEQYNLQGDVIYKEGKPDYKVNPNSVETKPAENGTVLEIDPD